VASGLAYYLRFLKKFPTVQALAKAKSASVLKVWEGLGYYNRALNMHAAARTIAGSMKGQFPRNHWELIKLKGIGPYTSRAIGSLAFNNPVAVLDGNVARFLSRYLGDHSEIDKAKTKNYFTEILDRWIAGHNPGSFNQAMMDLGSLVCTPKNPHCNECPVSDLCIANELNLTGVLPLKTAKSVRKKVYFNYYFAWNEKSEFAIRQRPESGLWAGLWELPQEERSMMQWKREQKLWKEQFLGEFLHVLTHRDVLIRVYEKDRSEVEHLLTGRFIDPPKISKFAFSRAVQKVFQGILP